MVKNNLCIISHRSRFKCKKSQKIYEKYTKIILNEHEYKKNNINEKKIDKNNVFAQNKF